MNTENSGSQQGPPSPSADTGSAESKRIAARRRFIRGSAVAAGSGAIILTLYHQRAIAGKKIMTSSAAVCTSMNGTPGKIRHVKDITNPQGAKLPAVECELPK